MARTYAYRAEISGGFSGSAYRYESILTGSLAEVERFIEEMTGYEQSGAMMITEQFAGVLDVLQDGERVFRASFLPVLVLRGGDRTFRFEDGAWLMDGMSLGDDDTLQANLDVIIDAFIEGTSVELSLCALGLPSVEGEPLANGAALDVTNAAGVTYRHVCGEIAGDFGEAYEYEPKR